MLPRARRLLRRAVETPVISRAATTGLRAAGGRYPAAAQWGALHLHRPGSASVRLADGGRLLLDGGRRPDWVTHDVYWQGAAPYEPEVMPAFLALASSSAVIVDAGANIGLYSLLAARANPDARVFAFEPVPAIFEILRSNVVLNKNTNTVVVQAALGAQAGIAPIFTPAGFLDTTGSARIEHRVTWTNGPFQCQYTPVISLDAFAQEHSLPGVNVLKIDVEGAEDQVLTGARAVIERDRPHVFCELLETDTGHRAAAVLTEMLLPLGYHAYLLTPSGPQPRSTIQPGPDWNHLLTLLSPAELAHAMNRGGQEPAVALRRSTQPVA